MAKISLNFNPDLFNSIFWLIRAAWNNSKIRFIWIYGGSSASKTYSVVQQSVMDLMEGKDNNILVLRKFATDIRDSIYSDFKTIIADWGLENKFIIQQNYIKCSSGSYVRFRGLDDSEKVKGISSFKKIILEEVSQFEHVDFKQIRKRLRGKDNQQIIGIFNPISQDHWIKKKIFDLENLLEVETTIAGKWISEKNNTIVLRTNYLDNIFIVGKWLNDKLIGGRVDTHVIEDFETDKVNDPDYYYIYGLGHWGEINDGENPFATQFDATKHVSDVPFYDKNKQLIFAIDFNLTPFCVTFHHYWQDNEGVHWHQFDEGEITKGSVPAMIDYIWDRYQYSLPNAIATGDAMGKNGQISDRDNASLYKQLLDGLNMRESQLKVSNNPKHQHSRTQTNFVLSNFPDFKVHSKCKGSISDWKNVQADAFGSLIKKDRKDTNQRADFIDTNRYFIHNILYKWTERNMKQRKK